ncbi:unnamed protein product [Phytophthora lilii]|uniref:Unnamed protein product n=1 Tax=Phytophthora lilii TaxID=2077276 RepID=A0A9W6TD55_9STRA|nr:unnamed protein product [Phytophthora lilii]
MILQDFTIGKIRSTNAKVFVNWSEFTSSRAARRVVNAQVRGHAQRRVLQMHFAQWVTYISVLRWQQILCARAEQHYRKVILQKCFERWQHNVILRRRYRKKTRVALVHWKLTLQRRVFDGWKQYLHIKREKQQRIHEALEFRHKQFVRLGLRYWMTAALHLQEQREQRVTIAQASNTANIWRRVATIARHWRYLTIRRQAITEHREAFESLRDQQPRHQSTHWPTEQIQLTRAQEAKTVALPRNGNLLSQGHMWGNAEVGFSRANERSPLSDFVLLPRNRPQPRRPIEVMLFGHADNNDPPQENEGTNVREALRCGFDFPAEPFAPLASPPDHEIDQTRCPQKLPSTRIANRELEKGAGSCLATAAPKREGGYLPLPNTTVRQLDDLERQLLALSQRKKEWKIFQQQLEAVRVEADRNPRMRAKLQSLEEHHAVRTKQWLHTKGRIRLLATEIQQLRNAFQR